MKNLVRITAVALLAGAVTWATGTAWAALVTADLNCQKEIQTDSLAYIAAVQKAAATMINLSQSGKGNLAPPFMCMSGPNVGKPCQGNNGGCKVGKTPCNENDDCAIASDSCVAATGCQGKGCKTSKVPCNSNSDCGTGDTCTSVSPLDTNECQASTNKAIVAAQATLLKKMLTKCAAADPVAIGLTHLSDCLIGRCLTGGSPDNTAAPCNKDNEQAVCGGPSLCDFGGDSGSDWISHLAACIETGADGDFDSGKVVDTILRPFAKMTGTGGSAPAGLKTDPSPRQVIQLNGSEWLAIGTHSGSKIGTQGGAVQYLSLASCSGGSKAPLCLNNKDCGTGGTCTDNSKVCVATALDTTPVTCGTGGVDPTCASHGGSCGTKLTGPMKVDKCCLNTETIGFKTFHPSCISNADCAGVGNSCGYSQCSGNVLSISESSSAGSTTCLVTHTANSGNDTTSSGAIDVTTGMTVTQSPILTDVYLLTGFSTGCGRCDSTHKCDANSTNVGAKCTGAAGSIDQGCFPNGFYLGMIPNPFILTTATKTLNPVSVPPASGPREFCGFCAATPAIGCQSAADCPTALDKCDFSATNAGFYGDPTITQVTATGEAHQYAPTLVGVFCTGQTSSGLVNGSAGLPGPVRIIQPYIYGYNFSKD